MTEISGSNAFEKCLDFLNSISVKIVFGAVDESFLPGITIDNGIIIIDKEKLKYPGDVLHEAGHIAVVPEAERNSLNQSSIEKREMREAEEMMAIAWSYAACIHLNISPEFVFHEGGYQRGGKGIAESFKNKQYFGVSMLQWVGLTVEEKNAKEKNIQPYPAMTRWLRD